MNIRTNIRHWHSAHSDCLRTLKFYKEEIGILTERLAEIAQKNTAYEVTVQVEHFQNAFILHRNNIDELSHAIRQNITRVAGEIASHTGFVATGLLAQLEKEKKIFHEEEREINLLRHAFNLFCAEWM